MTSVPPAPEQPTAQPAPPAPSYGAPSYAAVPQPSNPGTNVLAIVGFACSFVVALAGIICGHIALSQIKRTGESGRGFALAAVIIGYCSVALSVFLVVVWIALIAAATAGSAYYGR